MTKHTLSAPRTAMAVRPLLLAALNAYSTWYSRPSGEKMVLQAGRARMRRKEAQSMRGRPLVAGSVRGRGGQQASAGGAAPGLHRCSHVAVVAAATAARHLHRERGNYSSVRRAAVQGHPPAEAAVAG